MTRQRTQHPLNHIRIHRHRSGLTQQEVERLLGYLGKGSVARYERRRDLPSLATAIGFEIVFCTPVSELFWGLRDGLKREIETRVAMLEKQLGQRSAKDHDASATAKKLMWLSQRKSSEALL